MSRRRKATGHLRITAPGRFWPPPCGAAGATFPRSGHPDVTISLNLSDRVVELAGEAVTAPCAWGDLPDSSLVSVRIADNRRLCVATRLPAAPRHAAPPRELVQHDCPHAVERGPQTGLGVPHAGRRRVVPRSSTSSPAARLDCSDGQVLHDWCLAGYGIAWRSTWEVEAEIAAGRLVEVLHDCGAAQRHLRGVPQRKHLPLRCGCGSSTSSTSTHSPRSGRRPAGWRLTAPWQTAHTSMSTAPTLLVADDHPLFRAAVLHDAARAAAPVPARWRPPAPPRWAR